ncbi:MAG TPA: DUF6457 domain-containing protein [Clostridia bacterium]|nr:DUF6457 domain-containing protein [Clostridia bacterium]
MSAQPQIAEYFADFGRRLARLVHVRGVEIEAPTLSSVLADEVLQLAAAVAHTSERTFAPLASFVTGIVVGELRAAGQLRSDGEIAALVAQLRTELDASTDRQPRAGT